MTATTIDETKLEAFLGQLLTEAGAAMNATLIRVGDELGLFRAMGDAQPVDAPPMLAAPHATRTSATCASG